MTPMIILLDFDGTLADSLDVMRGVYREFLAAHGITGGAPDFETFNGPPVRDIVARLKAGYRLRGAVQELTAHYESLIDAAYRAVAPGPGARELLDACDSAGWTCGVVSSNSRVRIASWLERTGLSEHIGLIIGGDDVTRGKPAPDGYLAALATLRCSPGGAVAVEDSLQGAAAARAAGLRTYGLGARPASPWPADIVPIGSLAALPDLLAEDPLP